ncbi:neuropeptides capa receptor-like isoform X2 [Neocloeon triangulifer]|uniref:neuropeptides capa receptor-like isoform X2 n=1 Tax=Neocloeon triangulifer TaxID=2078957 RepID=UPI00286F4D09|nr:neuropeptides capa receptor-like isoform X2 [Neocloeon triangulifer]
MNMTIEGFSNSTLKDILQNILGFQPMGLPILITITAIYAIMFTTGILGNALVCVVIVKQPNMRTATNFYLFSLATADIIILLSGIPLELYEYWNNMLWGLGEAACKMRMYVLEIASYVSVLTIVAFSMERYLAICHPLHAYAMSGLRRASRIVAAIWLVSIACAIPFYIITRIFDYYVQRPESAIEKLSTCQMEFVKLGSFPVFETSCVVFFVIPLSILLIMYTQIGLVVSRRKNIGESQNNASSQKPVIMMLSAVVVSFFVCWAPFHAQRIFSNYINELGASPEDVDLRIQKTSIFTHQPNKSN